MSELPKCKLCGADAATHKVFGGIKYCCSLETCTMHDKLMLKREWRTLMTQQQADQDRLRFKSACEISGDKHPEYVRGYEAAMDAVCKARQQAEPMHISQINALRRNVLRNCGEHMASILDTLINTRTAAQPAPIPRNERMPALADADPFGMVAWWNSFDNFWVLKNWDSKPARPIFTHWLPTGMKMPPAPGGSDE